MALLADALGVDPAGIRERIEALGGARGGLGDLGADRGKLRRVVDATLSRSELRSTPDPPGREELERLLASAW
jgi:alcohol dehydrogenase class IV